MSEGTSCDEYVSTRDARSEVKKEKIRLDEVHTSTSKTKDDKTSKSYPASESSSDKEIVSETPSSDESENEDMYRGRNAQLDGLTTKELLLAAHEEEAERKRGLEWKFHYKKCLQRTPTFEEKLLLCKSLPTLPIRHLQIVLRIIADETNQHELAQGNEVEVAIDTLSDSTIYKLEHFVRDPRGYYAACEQFAIERRIELLRTKLGIKQGTILESSEGSKSGDQDVISIDDCRRHFDIPLMQASRLLKASPLTLCRIIRAHGYGQWPTNTLAMRDTAIFENAAKFKKRTMEFAVRFFPSPELQHQLKEPTNDVENALRYIMAEVRSHARKRRDTAVASCKQVSKYQPSNDARRVKKKLWNQRHRAYRAGLDQALYRAVRWLVIQRRSQGAILTARENSDVFTPSNDMIKCMAKPISDNAVSKHLSKEMNHHINELAKEMTLHEAKVRIRMEALKWFLGYGSNMKDVPSSRDSQEGDQH